MRRHPVGLIALSLACLVAGACAEAATLYVTEFAEPSPVTFQAASAPPLRSTTVTIAASSAQSLAFTGTTKIVRLHCDVACQVEVGGTNPTAVATSARLAAGQTEYYKVKPGAKVAVITATAP